MTTTTQKAPVTLGSLALTDAVAAAKGADESTLKATISLALVMANGQNEAVEADKEIDDAKNKAYFRQFLKHYAFRGHMVWRDSDAIIAEISAMGAGSDKRRKAASDYIDGGKQAEGRFRKPDGARLVDGLARLRTWSFRLMKDVCTNHAGALRDILALKASGADAQALRDRFARFVKETYGDTWSAFTASLADDKPKKEIDPIDSIVKKAKEMTDTDLARLVKELNQLHAERLNQSAEMDEAFDEGDEEELAA